MEMADIGAYPGETQKNIAKRNKKFIRDAKASGSI
jgi:hypothetical protein